MAEVDFSNAVLDVFEGNEYVSAYNPMSTSDYMQLKNSSVEYFYNLQGNGISVPNPVVSILSNTPTKVSISYVGTFNSSGTEFLIGLYSVTGGYKYAGWKVSNVSFSSGDTYSCIIDIEVSGNS